MPKGKDAVGHHRDGFQIESARLPFDVMDHGEVVSCNFLILGKPSTGRRRTTSPAAVESSMVGKLGACICCPSAHLADASSALE